VVFAKVREARPRPEPNRPAEPPPRPSSSANLIWSLAVAGVLCVAGIGWVRVRQPRPPKPVAPPASAPPPAGVPGGPPSLSVPEMGLPPATLPPARPPISGDQPLPGELPLADAAIFRQLADRIQSGRATLADVDAAAALQARYPTEPHLQRLVTELLMAVAGQHSGARRPAEAVATLRRAAALPWADARVRSALLTAIMNTADWPAVETYANTLLAFDRTDVDAWYALGYALFRLDRNREAVEALRNALQIRNDPRASELLARLEKNAIDERGMTDRQLAHFHVRYDGDEHDDVGREVLKALERHYMTLVIDLDHRPQSAIPVVLFSSEQYYDASGAPAWSGGNYDSIDGRIRLPIGGLTRNLTDDLDGTLMHELTHAFIADKTGGVAPREIHEGLAQYMEGKRADARMSTALATGQISGVHAYYLQALSFVEYLISLRGQGGMNDLLKAMAETGSVDSAFQRVHGSSQGDLQKAWRKRLDQKYGG
jgi:tetratricopeptide (TPR) repeat protein